MVFIRYFFKRYCYYVGTITLLLTALLTLIELFEKLMRVSHASFAHIGMFLGLNALPVLVDNCAVGCWLATGLLLREFYVHHEWELMMMLNINNKELIRLFVLAGCLFAGVVMVSKELFVCKLAFKAEQFKVKHFKQKAPQLLVHRWIQLSDSRFCHIGMLDMGTNSGQNITVLTMSPDFSIEQALIGSTFSVDLEANQLIIEQGSSFDAMAHQCLPISQKVMTFPELFSQLSLEDQVPTALNLYPIIVHAYKQLPNSVVNKLLYQLLKIITSYFYVLLYSLITILLFTVWYGHNRLRWIALCAAYPLFLTSQALLDFLVAYGCSAWIALAPIALVALFAILAGKYLIK
jgi:lipopolysaccharide export LptBFGC system permease protein LptF